MTGLFLCGGAILWSGCGSAEKKSAERIVTVRTEQVAPSAGASMLNYVGTVEEESGAGLSFKVQGTVLRTYADEGQQVHKGMLLAELDAASLRQTYNATKASFEQAEDAMRRMKTLFDGGSLPEIKYIEVQTKLEQARSMYEIAKQNLSDARLIAPASGVIGRRAVEAGENALPGKTAFTLLDIRTVKVKVSVPEQEIARITTETEAVITVPALGNKTYTGRIAEKGVVANAMAHTYDARISLPNKDNTLMPGMVCNVSLALDGEGQKPFIVVPNRAVQVSDTDRRFVWCVKDGVATAVTVETGALTERGVIITNGLTEGMEVIVEGMQKLSEGTKVKKS